MRDNRDEFRSDGGVQFLRMFAVVGVACAVHEIGIPMRQLFMAAIVVAALGHAAAAQTKFEIVFTSAGFAEPAGTTGYAAYILDRSANKGNYCTAHYFQATPEKAPSLTSECVRLSDYKSRLPATARIQSRSTAPVVTVGFPPNGVWQIDQDTGATEFCLLETEPTRLPNGNCITVALQ
jgi:hypothetical protein